MKKYNSISNQVFIGCPWKTVRPKYERMIERFKKKYPLSFIIVGRGEDQKAEDLLSIIKERLFCSSSAIFDATFGNANVSLEYGMAEVAEIPHMIYVSRHKKSKDAKSDSAIISDLAGKKRNDYTQLNSLLRLLDQFIKGHSYSKRYEVFLRKNFGHFKRGKKRSARALTLKIIHFLDGKDSVRRSDLVQELIGQNYEEIDVNDGIRKLHAARLIYCSEGRYSAVSIK